MSSAHAELDPKKEKDTSGGVLTTDEKDVPVYSDDTSDPSFEDGAEYPTEEELKTLRHVPFSAQCLTSASENVL